MCLTFTLITVASRVFPRASFYLLLDYSILIYSILILTNTEDFSQLKSLMAQSPAAQDASRLSPFQVEVTEYACPDSVLEAPEETHERLRTSTPSYLTEMDESMLEDPSDTATVSQSVSTESHFISSTAPRVSYEVTASGELMITEGIQTSNPTTPARGPRPGPPPALVSFDRIAQGLPPKPASSSTTATTHPPSLSVERLIGPKQPIPARILDLFEQWHEAEPNTEHPAALTGRAPSTWKNFRAFSDDADECELSVFQILLKCQNRRILSYRIMILHSQNGPEELVVFGQPRPKFKGPWNKGVKGLYLLDWSEIEKKGEVRACGIKLWRTDDKNIAFSAYMFDDGRKCTRFLDHNAGNKQASSSTPKKQSDGNEHVEDTQSISSEPPFSPSRSGHQIPSSLSRAENETEDRTPRASRWDHPSPMWAKSISPVPTPNNYDGFRSLASPWKPQKRRRSSWSSNDQDSDPIRFKLMSDVSDQVRVFKTLDAKVLFEKAWDFYKGVDNRTGLLCTIAGLDGVRYVGDGCVDEFDILQEDIMKSSCGDEDRVVEVKPAMGF